MNETLQEHLLSRLIESGACDEPWALAILAALDGPDELEAFLGTRYYGSTARGEYMTESEAARQGHRPAGRRSCAPSSNTPTAAAVPSTSNTGVTHATASAAGAGNPATRVWVNHELTRLSLPGTRYSGTTKYGQHMPQDEAQAAGNRPASGKHVPDAIDVTGSGSWPELSTKWLARICGCRPTSIEIDRELTMAPCVAPQASGAAPPNERRVRVP
jgi:hypothetical protein